MKHRPNQGGNKRRFTEGQLATLAQLRRLLAKGYVFGHNGHGGDTMSWWAEKGGLGKGGHTVIFEWRTMRRLEIAGCFRRTGISFPLHTYTLHPRYVAESSTEAVGQKAES